MKGKSKRFTVPKTGSPVLDAWALLGELERSGFDARGALDKLSGTPPKTNVDPPTRISPEGVPIITREEIQGMSPKQVGIRFYNSVLSAASQGNVEWEVTLERLRHMPQHWRLAYSLGWLQAEVDNGGHEQFFSNGQGKLDDVTEADLQFIGADRFLKLFRKARKFYYSAPGGFTERLPEIEPLDNAFYKQKKNLFVLVGEHVLSHPADYHVN